MALTQLKTGAIADDAVTTDKLANAINTERTANTAKVSLDADAVTGAKIADDAIDSEHITDGSIDNAHLADDAVGVAELSATGTASSSTFLRGDNSWATPTDTNTVTTINNNADNRVITGSGTANTLEGEASLTFDAGLLKIDDTGGTAGKGRLEFGNSGEQFIEGFDTGNAGSGSYLKFGDGSTERMRVGQNGQVYVGCTDQLSDYASDKTKLSIWHTGDSGGYLEVGGDQTANGYSAGTILFCNTNNSSSITNVGMQRAEIVTSDSNAGDDSGADLVFHTRAEAGNLNESFRIKSTRDVQITDGNLIIGTAGHGIDFSAQTGTGGGTGQANESELLNHYEEGKLNATAISSGLTFTTAGGTNKNIHYVRIGNWVTVSGYLEVSSFTSDGTNIQIQMPFTSASNSDGYYTRGVGATMAAQINLPSTAYLTAYVGGGENYMRLYYTQDSASYHQMVNSDLTSNSGIYFSLSYGI